MSYTKIFAIAALGLFLAACKQTPVENPDPVDTSYGGGADTSAGGIYGQGGGEEIPDNSMDDEMLGNVIYFEFDSSDVRPQDQDLVAAHAVALNQDTFRSVRLEGHADERGSREYNIGLAERRAQAVRQMLMIQGVNASQIQTVSFGEERPVAFGHTESDYAQNRRVEIKYTK
jgi:peptidoglycan-associated lipoprotein